MKVRYILAGAMLTALAFSDGGGAQPSTAARPTQGGFLAQTYLKADQLPDSAVLLPPPPASGSAAKQRDEEAANAALAQQGSARWLLATRDAELMKPNALSSAFSCAAGFEITAESMPVLSALLRQAAADIAISTMPAKRKYQRSRPFMENGKPTCSPEMESVLRHDGSYPSGHSALGFGIGLILSQIVPSRATELVARGQSFGDSRRICNVHWLSDIEAGRFMAAATVARLNADPAFQRDLARARAEADRVVATNPPVGRGCAAEAAAIAETPGPLSAAL